MNNEISNEISNEVSNEMNNEINSEIKINKAGVNNESSVIHESLQNVQKRKNNPESVDVIIPVYKPDTKFSQLIERLLKQSKKPGCIILLETVEEGQGISETMYEILSLGTNECRIERYEIKKSEFDHGGTRNYGATLSEAEILVFMTQDAVPYDIHLIRNLTEPFSEPQIAGVYGRQLAMPKAGIIEKYTRQFNYPEQSSVKSIHDLERLGIKTYFCSNVCAAYRKTAYNQVGGFVTKTIFNEDMIMAAGLLHTGYYIAYAADAKVYHSHTYTYRQQFKRNFDLAVSQEQYSHVFSKAKSENEGIKLVKNTIKYLAENKQYHLVPDLILQSGFKYLGYKAGKKYKKLPQSLVKKWSMNPSFWN